MDTSTTSKANARLALSWLRFCEKNHPACNLPHTPALPRQLLDISDPRIPHLVDSRNMQAQYVTLSYKWGSTSRFCTTSANIDEYMCSIPYDSMPKTIQQAVDMSSAMGYQYLWIDALCIIQDLPQDVHQEIDSMDRVYKNASFTIFAACGDNADDGFSRLRDPRWIKPCLLSIKTTSRQVTHSSEHYFNLCLPLCLQYQKEPVFRRGWVLQEQILSRRGLIFGENGMEWSCMVGSADEGYPQMHQQMSDEWYEYHMRDPKIQPLKQFVTLRWWLQGKQMQESKLPYARSNHLNHFDFWYHMVVNYNMRELTYGNDVLKALRGLSNALGEKYARTANHGLWMEDLQIGLSWYINEGGGLLENSSSSLSSKRQPSLPSSPTTNMPSWTWASQRGQHIRFHGWHWNSTLYPKHGVRNVSSKEEKEDPRILHLSGYIREATVIPFDPSPPLWSYHDMRGFEANDCGRDAAWLLSIADPISETCIGHIAFDSREAMHSFSAVQCLLTQVRQTGCIEQTCLALVATGDGSKNRYKRAGLVFLRDMEWFGVDWDRGGDVVGGECRFWREVEVV